MALEQDPKLYTVSFNAGANTRMSTARLSLRGPRRRSPQSDFPSAPNNSQPGSFPGVCVIAKSLSGNDLIDYGWSESCLSGEPIDDPRDHQRRRAP